LPSAVALSKFTSMAVKTVPICDDCWHEEHGYHLPVRMKEPDKEHCYNCKQETRSGIYVRRQVADD
jgi:hypothetical protein